MFCPLNNTSSTMPNAIRLTPISVIELAHVLMLLMISIIDLLSSMLRVLSTRVLFRCSIHQINIPYLVVDTIDVGLGVDTNLLYAIITVLNDPAGVERSWIAHRGLGPKTYTQ